MYGTIFYSEIPKVKQVQGIEGAALTQMNLDKSMILQDLLTSLEKKSGLKERSWKELLGELQFAFVSFLLGENYDSFEQWKALLVLICHCQQALISDQTAQLFFEFIPVVYAQIEQLPIDFFTVELSKNNFITACMQTFIFNCDHVYADKVELRIKQRAKKLESMLVKQFFFKPLKSEETRIQKMLQQQQQDSTGK